MIYKARVISNNDFSTTGKIKVRVFKEIRRLDVTDILIFLKKEKYCIKRKFAVRTCIKKPGSGSCY